MATSRTAPPNRRLPSVVIAWATSATVGLPAIALTAWALAGTFAFRRLPFALVPWAIPFIAAPLMSLFLTVVRGRLRRVGMIGAIVIVAVAGIASLLLVPVLAVVSVFSLLDDSGQVHVNFPSMVGAAIDAAAYAAMSCLLVITLIATHRETGGTGRGVGRQMAVASAGLLVVLITAAGIGALQASRSDANGIPLGPISASWIASRAESRFIYPGGDVVQQSSGAEERRVVDSAQAGTRIDFYASDGEGKAVSDWYSTRLLASGWRPIDMIGTSVAKAQWSYKRGDRELFLIELLQPSLFPADAGHLGMQHFWVTYWVFPEGAEHV